MLNNNNNNNDNNNNYDAVKVTSYVIKNNSISFLMNDKPYNINSTHPNYHQIRQCFKEPQNFQDLLSLVDIPKSLTKSSNGRITVENDTVLYDGEPIHHVVADKITQFLSEGFPITPLVNFLEKLMQNPSKRSVDQLYPFIEQHDITINENGNILMYKAVNGKLRDKYSNSIDNSVGSVVEVPRNKVSDDPRSACSFGLHAGAESYVFGNNGAGGFACHSDKVILVEIDPKDVVSIPFDCSHSKFRVCKYKVVSVLDNLQERMQSKLYSNSYQPISSDSSYDPYLDNTLDDDYDDYFDEEDWDDYYDEA